MTEQSDYLPIKNGNKNLVISEAESLGGKLLMLTLVNTENGTKGHRVFREVEE